MRSDPWRLFIHKKIKWDLSAALCELESFCCSSCSRYNKSGANVSVRSPDMFPVVSSVHILFRSSCRILLQSRLCVIQPLIQSDSVGFFAALTHWSPVPECFELFQWPDVFETKLCSCDRTFWSNFIRRLFGFPIKQCSPNLKPWSFFMYSIRNPSSDFRSVI